MSTQINKSGVALPEVLSVCDRNGHPSHLYTIGDAIRFLEANIAEERISADYVQEAFASLKKADSELSVTASDKALIAVVLVLRLEKLMPDQIYFGP